jgi:hypothetical protein
VHAFALPIVSVDYRIERPSLSVADPRPVAVIRLIRVPWP